MTHVFMLSFSINLITVELYTLSRIGIVVCLSIPFLVPWISLRSYFILRILALYIILCNIPFDYIII